MEYPYISNKEYERLLKDWVSDFFQNLFMNSTNPETLQDDFDKAVWKIFNQIKKRQEEYPNAAYWIWFERD
jgi:hypothetical protein